MLTRIREPEEGSYEVSVYDAAGVIEMRKTAKLADAFAMQKAVQSTGKWPDGKEPKK